jgi:uncharacterized protein YjbJ (UPF0337 family)
MHISVNQSISQSISQSNKIATMSEPSKTNAQYNQAMGSVKETVGSALGNHEMEAKGNVQNKEGHAEQSAAEIKGWVEGAIDSVVGAVKDTFGSLTGNTSQQAEGKAQQLKGDAQKSANS